MTASFTPPRVPPDALRDAIADAIAIHVKDYNVPAVTERLGLKPGAVEEASRSKRLYVKTRILVWDEAELIALAKKVIAEFGAPGLADVLSEKTLPDEHRVSEITRRDILKALNPLDRLFGDTDFFAGLRLIAKDPHLGRDSEDVFGFETLTGQIQRHYLENPDWTPEELLLNCGALECTQARFFQLIEKLLDPVVRRGEEQRQLAQTLSAILQADGFHIVVVGEQSRHPRYGIQRLQAGVTGKPKNLIFAAINTKPDLYFLDAINNDIGIHNRSDALVFEDFLPESGLRWSQLTQWWQTQAGSADPERAPRAFYRRLLHAVQATRSPGQYALFTVYYHTFPAILKEALPALIPEVYLHYDPRALWERRGDPALLRQRMDFLLLLDRARIVLEVDGRQHYAEGALAAPTKYAEMAAEDRRLRLTGYELYRFGAAEFSDTNVSAEGKITVGPRSRELVVRFFEALWRRHEIKPG
jgi:hypothetical protein